VVEIWWESKVVRQSRTTLLSHILAHAMSFRTAER
jgi:hypothetical protein